MTSEMLFRIRPTLAPSRSLRARTCCGCGFSERWWRQNLRVIW